MADPVEHHLGDGTLAVVVLAAGFVINGAGEAFERALARRGVALEGKRRPRRVGPGAQRDSLVDLQRLVGRELEEEA